MRVDPVFFLLVDFPDFVAKYLIGYPRQCPAARIVFHGSAAFRKPNGVTEMMSYWAQRMDDAQARADKASSIELREVYLGLMQHYREMARCYSHQGIATVRDYQGPTKSAHQVDRSGPNISA